MKSFTWHIYDLATGRFTGKCLRSTDPAVLELALRKAPNCGAKEGQFDPRSQRVDLETGEVVEAEDVKMESATQMRKESALLKLQALEARQPRIERDMRLRQNEVGADGKTPEQRYSELDAEITRLRSIVNGETETTER